MSQPPTLGYAQTGQSYQPRPGDPFSHSQYTIRQKVFKIFGEAFHVYAPDGSLLMYSKQKAFRLKEDMRIYTDESMQTPLLTIMARSIIDFGATYDVVDARTNQPVGALRRRGLRSMLRDEWLVLDAGGGEVGRVIEDSMIAALARRFVEVVALVFPQKFHVEIAGRTVATYQQNFNPFVRKLQVNIAADGYGVIDPRLGVAIGILLAAIEGKEQA